jgi:hypothetical protein
MSRGFLALFAFAVVSPGCVPVTEPVGDIDKAEPDKNLVGKWDAIRGDGRWADLLKLKSLTVGAPDVEGNPKGLMRGTMNQDDGMLSIWFFTSTVGKHTYLNFIEGPAELLRFDEKGAFAKWKKETKKEYFVSRAARDDGRLTLDCGNIVAFTALMKGANIKDVGMKHFPRFQTPIGWLAKYLDKDGPDKIFDGTNVLVLTREKK